MDGKKNGRRMLDLDELDKVVGAEECRKERDPSRQRFTGNAGSPDQYVTPPDPLTPEQIQALLDAAMENPHKTGPVKK